MQQPLEDAQPSTMLYVSWCVCVLGPRLISKQPDMVHACRLASSLCW